MSFHSLKISSTQQATMAIQRVA